MNMKFLRGSLLKLTSKILRVVHSEQPQYNQDNVQIKCITMAKCDLFFHCCDSKEISCYYFRDTKLCAKHRKHVNFIDIVGIMFVR